MRLPIPSFLQTTKQKQQRQQQKQQQQQQQKEKENENEKQRLQIMLKQLYKFSLEPETIRQILIVEGKYKQLSNTYNQNNKLKLTNVISKLDRLRYTSNLETSRIFKIPYVNMAMTNNSPIKQLHKNFINGVDEQYIPNLILDIVIKTNRLMKRPIFVKTENRKKNIHGKITTIIDTIHGMIVNKNGASSINKFKNKNTGVNIKIEFMNKILNALSELNTLLNPTPGSRSFNLRSCNSIKPRNNMFVNCKYTNHTSIEYNQNFPGSNLSTPKTGSALTLTGSSLEKFMVLWGYAQKINPNISQNNNNNKLFTNLNVHQ